MRFARDTLIDSVSGVNTTQLVYVTSAVTLNTGAVQMYLNQGDLVSLRPDTAVTQSNSPALHHFEISKIG